jgi:hypothetical protein
MSKHKIECATKKARTPQKSSEKARILAEFYRLRDALADIERLMAAQFTAEDDDADSDPDGLCIGCPGNYDDKYYGSQLRRR